MVNDDHIHPLLLTVNSNMGVVLAETRSFDEARVHFQEAKEQFYHLQQQCRGEEFSQEQLISMLTL